MGVKRITIVGLGLIGGSMGLALKRAGLEGVELIGYARNLERAKKAISFGAVDEVEDNLASAVNKADVVILAIPPLAMKGILEQLGNHLPSGCIVTDTASTKVKVMEWAEEYLPATIPFIGGHPMAGKELSGIGAAEATLFEGCTYCLIPGRNASPQSVEVIASLVKNIRANPLFITASEHDSFVAAISHLPLILSAALVSATTKDPYWGKISRLATTGYRDVTRLASQNPQMNRDICLTNQQNIVKWVDQFMQELSWFRQLIADNSGELEEVFTRVRQERQRWLEEYGKKS